MGTYNEQDVRDFAIAIAAAVKSVKEQGLGVQSAGFGVQVITSLAAAANEAQEDTIAFLLHLASELTNIAGDLRVADIPPTE